MHLKLPFYNRSHVYMSRDENVYKGVFINYEKHKFNM